MQLWRGDWWGRLVVAVYTRTPVPLRDAVQRAVTPSYRLAVCVLVRRPDGRVLLVRHPYSEGWSTVGGDVKRRESVQAAGARELREEVGVRAAVPPPTVAHQNLSTRWVVMSVLVDVGDEVAEAVRSTSPEISAVQWFAPDALPDLGEDATRTIGLLLG